MIANALYKISGLAIRDYKIIRSYDASGFTSLFADNKKILEDNNPLT